jgi:hypothetical protein
MAVYLDYNATTPVAPAVIRKITDSLNNAWGNPSSGYEPGVKSKRCIAEARRHIALMISGKPEDIIFTSGGTEVCGIHRFVELVIDLVSLTVLQERNECQCKMKIMSYYNIFSQYYVYLSSVCSFWFSLYIYL